MTDKNIKGAPVSEPVGKESGYHSECPQVRFPLGVLVGPIGPVAHGTAEAADQYIFMTECLEVQI